MNSAKYILSQFGLPEKDWKHTHISNNYLVSRFGEVISLLRSARFLKKTLTPQGYFYVSLMVDGKPKKFCVHRLVAEVFVIGKSELTKTVNHINGNKTDNCATNLAWATYFENNDHAKRTSLNNCYCEGHFASKLSNEQVGEIKANKLGLSKYELASKFGVDRRTIGKILSGKSWRRHGI